MIRTYLSHIDLIKQEPRLHDYLSDDQINYDLLIDQAKLILEQDVKNKGYKLRWLCTTLPLTDGTKSVLDKFERTRLVVNVSALTDEATFILSGTNDDSDETYTEILNGIGIAEKGIHEYSFSQTFNYYKLDATGTVTFTAFLVEKSFELVHLYLSLALVYKQLQALEGDMWNSKAEYYYQMYHHTLEALQFSYDLNEDGEIDEEETLLHRTTFRR